MSDIEQRLRSALEARAALVQPEDLTLNPVLEPTEPETGPWWQRPGSYLFVAAVALIVIALPLLALANTMDDDGKRDEDQVAPSPTDPTTMTDPVPMEIDKGAADVDGDGTKDSIRVVELDSGAEPRPRSAIEVDLSSTGETVSYRYPRLGTLELAEAADVDGRRGLEVFAVLEPTSKDLHRSAPSVISLRDGELTEILDEDFGIGYWWVGEGAQLWWWQSEDEWPAGTATIGPVEATSFRHGDRLQPVDAGSWCVDPTVPDDLQQCGGGEPPDSTGTDGGTTGEPEADPWWEEHPEGLPSTWAVEGEYGGGATGDLDGNGSTDTASVAGSEVRVDLGDEVLTAAIDGANPALEGVVALDGSTTPVVLGHTTEGAAGTTYVTWFAFAVIDGELVRLNKAPLGPPFDSIYSNLTTEEGGHPTVRTWVAGDNALYGMDYLDRLLVEGPDDTEVWAYEVRVRTWYVDGTTLRATVPVHGCVAPEIGREFYQCPDGL